MPPIKREPTKKPASMPPEAPTVRLVAQGDSTRPNRETFQAPKPDIRLAHVPGAQGDNVLLGRNGVAPLPDTHLPALLVSFYYLKQFDEHKHRYRYRDWVMDSGAFSAHNSGADIDLQEYIDCCKQRMAKDPKLVEVYALDVIGDWKASLKNTEEMWKQGVPAIPCYHINEPWSVLKGLAKDYPKVALGGVALLRGGKKLLWAKQCFARVWPKKIHGFGFGTEKAVLTLPFHSTDATSWEVRPCRYGLWHGIIGTNSRCSVRGSTQNLRAEVEWYLDMEDRARKKWKKEMALLEEVSPTVRLAFSTGANGNSMLTGFGDKMGAMPNVAPPHVRLSGAADDVTDRRSIAFSERGKEQYRPCKVKRSKK